MEEQGNKCRAATKGKRSKNVWWNGMEAKQQKAKIVDLFLMKQGPLLWTMFFSVMIFASIHITEAKQG